MQFNAQSSHMRDRRRDFYDKLQRYLVNIGGLSVLVALAGLILYFMLAVLPLFKPAQLKMLAQDDIRTSQSLYDLHLSAQAKFIYLFDKEGNIYREDLTLDAAKSAFDASKMVSMQSEPVSFSQGSDLNSWYAYANASGEIAPFQISSVGLQDIHKFSYGSVHLGLNQLKDFRFYISNSESVFIGRSEQNQWRAKLLQKEQKFNQDEASYQMLDIALPKLDQATWYQLGNEGKTLYLLHDANLFIYHLQLTKNQASFKLRSEQLDVSWQGKLAPMNADLLTGGQSLLFSYANGQVSQWFEVREDGAQQFKNIRSFSVTKEEAQLDNDFKIIPSPEDKSFYRLHDKGLLDLFYSTTGEALFVDQKIAQKVRFAKFSIQGKYLFTLGQSKWRLYQVNKAHSNVSWRSLWSKVWYEGYDEPDFIWQSVTTNEKVESKYSLVPLVFGTLKAAFLALIFALPIALCGAIYTAYFMSAKIRQIVKPSIELMEALPSVILGFIAGVWLAPFVENNLLATLLLFLVVPFCFLGCALLWRASSTPILNCLSRYSHIEERHLESWLSILLMPILALTIYLLFSYSHWLELWWFNGDLKLFMAEHEINYVQRNTLIVGFAMGFAVIPSIFTLAEDAIFSVPKHLSDGARALGATPWQALKTVVLPTASAGIFSAAMIGFGRAIGETMIVLMATGNTPLVEMNIFEGLRSLAANIAIEMPESDVGSSHFRILILAALLLFGFTFILNSLAEVIRIRLREKYKAL